jgi:hypothetical protein
LLVLTSNLVLPVIIKSHIKLAVLVAHMIVAALHVT